MWWNPTLADFVPAISGVVDGLGQLSSAQFKIFEARHNELKVRIQKYMDANDKPLEFVLGLNQRLRHAYTRLHSLQMTYEQLRFCITDFQRLFLEMLGVLDYLEIYRPRMAGFSPPATVVEDCIGCFTNSSVVAQDCFMAGIPFWLVRPANYFRFAKHKIEEITDIVYEPEMLNIETNPLPHVPPFPPIFEGVMLDEHKHNALHQYCWTWLSYQNPFESLQESQDSHLEPSSSSPSNVKKSKIPCMFTFVLQCAC